jgi:hypothetical protein
MQVLYSKLNSLVDIEESMASVSPMKSQTLFNIKPLWKIGDLASMENVTDHVRFVESNIYCAK